MHTTFPPALILNIPGPPKTKENKGQFNKSFYFKTHEDIVNWEVKVNHLAIAEMKKRGFIGPYRGRCRIVAAQTYESWKRCDITNYWKSLNDALNGACWIDDSQVDAAESVRFVDRECPGVRIMVWFYDIDFNESFGTGKFSKTGNQIMKYPPKYAIFELRGYEYRTKIRCISRPEDAATSRFGTFERLLTLDERKRAKGSTTKRKSTKKGATNNGKAKAEGTKARRRGTGSTGNGRSARKRKSA
jgi:Holliday junction resolvase RusA-like endonuclease